MGEGIYKKGEREGPEGKVGILKDKRWNKIENERKGVGISRRRRWGKIWLGRKAGVRRWVGILTGEEVEYR